MTKRSKPYKLNLDCIDENLRDIARRAFDAREAANFIECAGEKLNFLELVISNVRALKRKGIYEDALLEAWYLHDASTRHFSLAQLELLFLSANRERLRDIGPVPKSELRLKLYRGVAGTHPYRRVRGLAWTNSLDMACWFACRRNGDDPAVYFTTVLESEVYCYIDKMSEGEFVCRPKRPVRLTLSAEELKAAARRVSPFHSWFTT